MTSTPCHKDELRRRAATSPLNAADVVAGAGPVGREARRFKGLQPLDRLATLGAQLGAPLEPPSFISRPTRGSPSRSTARSHGAGYPGLAVPSRDRRDEEEQRRRGCGAEEPGGEPVSGGDGGRQEGDGRSGDREQRGDEQARDQDGGDGGSLDRRVLRGAAGQRDELEEDEHGGGEERNAPDGDVFAGEDRGRTEDDAEADRCGSGCAPELPPTHRAAARASTGAAIGSPGLHDASAIPAPASCVRTASRSSSQVRQAVGPAAASASARYGSGSTSTIETW